MIYAAVCAVNGKFKRKGFNTLQVKKCKPVPYKHRVRGSQGIFARKAFPKRLTGTEARLIALRDTGQISEPRAASCYHRRQKNSYFVWLIIRAVLSMGLL